MSRSSLTLLNFSSSFKDENTRNKFLFFGDIERLDHFIPSMPSDFLATSDKVSYDNDGVWL